MCYLQTLAYSSQNGTSASNVSILMRAGDDEGDTQNSATTHILLTFPYFTSLYYDPSVNFDSAASSGYNATAISVLDDIAQAAIAKVNAAVRPSVGFSASLGLAVALGTLLSF